MLAIAWSCCLDFAQHDFHCALSNSSLKGMPIGTVTSITACHMQIMTNIAGTRLLCCSAWTGGKGTAPKQPARKFSVKTVKSGASNQSLSPEERQSGQCKLSPYSHLCHHAGMDCFECTAHF